MTSVVPAPHAPPNPSVDPRPQLRATIEVLVCGSLDRGDDGAPLLAADLIADRVDPEVRIRRVGQLDVDHLLSVPPGSGVVIVDAATGIPSGAVEVLPLRGYLDPEAPVRPRSSHALALPEVIGVADMLRHRPLVGRIVVIGARRFALGQRISASVARALPLFASAVVGAIGSVGDSLDGEPSPALGYA